MDEYIRKEVNLPELYKYALTKSLQTNFTLTEAAIDRIHLEILRELKTKCKNLVKEGLVTDEDISGSLDGQVAPILQEAKRVNKKRKFSWNTKMEKGLYNSFPSPVYDYEVVEGGENDMVVKEIRRWLCDFNNFCASVGGCWEAVGCNYDEVKEDLKVQKLLPGILTSSKTSRSINGVKVNSFTHIVIHPIEMKLFAHDPNAVEMVTEGSTLSTWKMKCSITKQGIRRLISDEGNIEFVFPCYSKVLVNSTVEADIEFKATKKYKVRTWAFMLSLGIGSILNICKSKRFFHRVKLTIRTPDSSVTLRKDVTIQIGKKQTRKFMGHYNDLKNINAMAGPHVNTTHSLLPGEPSIAKCVLDITFENLQIDKIIAEATRRNVPIELIAGDGHGQFRYNDREMKTPEYADAVFRNTKTGEYFSVQFKYTDETTDLIDMMQHWHTHWRGNPDNDNYPEEMRPENIKLVGPNDVVNTSKKRNIDVGDQVRSNFERRERIGFKYPNDETETMRTFHRDNETFPKDVVNSNKYGSQMKKEPKSVGSKINNVHTKLEKQPKLPDIALNEGVTTKMVDKAKTRMHRSGKDMRCKIANHEQTIMTNESEMKTTEKWRGHAEENLTYKQKPTIRPMLGKAALNASVMAAAEGIIVAVCTLSDEWKKYKDGEIVLGELVDVVAKKTSRAVGTTGGFVLATGGLNIWTQYATASGVAYARALTVASIAITPIVIVGMLLKNIWDTIKHWHVGGITKAEMKKTIGRSILGKCLSIGGITLCGLAIGGPLGLVVGAGLAIAVGVGDYFLGNKIWSIFVKEDAEEALVVLERRRSALFEDVLQAGYDLLDLTEYSTRGEIKRKYRAAILKYHPDKGGSAEIFHAVRAAYAFICNARHFDCDQ